jgi:Rrf2 family iron-sulfur cluster assembly transcriptional regulator
MVSQTGRYALRILGYLVDHPGQWVQGSQIAAETKIPPNYLSKILNQLRKGGFVLSQKGWGGGFKLKESARRAVISKVLDQFEGPRDDKRCFFEMRRCDANHPCSLHDHWEPIQAQYRRMLSSTTIGDLGATSVE